MKLLIISHTPHCIKNNITLGWSPTVKENDYIAEHFEEVRVIGFLSNPDNFGAGIAYSSRKIEPVPVKESGGKSLIHKIRFFSLAFYYLRIIHREARLLSEDDWIYVRCPSNIGLLACFYLIFNKKPRRWFKYAGNWFQANIPFSYLIQRWILRKNLCKGKVTVNCCYDNQPKHVLNFLNPCISEKELERAREFTKNKKPGSPIKLLFAGRIEKEKGIEHFFKICGLLKDKKLGFIADVVGSGKDINFARQLSKEMSLQDIVNFCGYMPREDLFRYYFSSDFLILPSFSEGWPKVLSEAMACKCVPLTSDIPGVSQIIRKFDCGSCLRLNDINKWVAKIVELAGDESLWLKYANNGQYAAHHFTYEDILLNRLKEEVLNKKCAE